MKAFVVNLKHNVERREYISSVLSPYKLIDVIFIEAVDGRQLTDSQKSVFFDSEGFLKEYNRPILPGEIGCTLSHQKVYKEIVSSTIKYALVFEDDIIPLENIDQHINKLEQLLDTTRPTIIVLSGWFWYTKTDKFDDEHKIAKMSDGYLTHAYAINLAAARLMQNPRPHLLADAWEKYITNGIDIYGITPHLIDQDWTNFESSITDLTTRGCKSNTFFQWYKIKRRTSLQHLLKFFGKFEPKSR